MSTQNSNAVAYSPVSPNSSQPPVTSATTTTPNPTKESPLITSTWGIGWQTPTFIIACYSLALAIAFAHLALFNFIDGKDAEGPSRIAPQGYITTASNIMANIFGFSLRASLTVSFCQYMWYLFRARAMKVSTIELLFSIRSNPLQIFRAATIRATPTLCVLALLMWISSLAVSFPPGAITISKAPRTAYGIISVPSFNASFMGNASGADANKFSLIGLSPIASAQEGFTTGTFDGGKDINLLNRLARQVLIAGDAFPMVSPCGANCSYTEVFEGPYMECTTTSQEVVVLDDGPKPIYTGRWYNPPGAQLAHTLYNGTYTLGRFNSSTLKPLSLKITDEARNASIIPEVTNTPITVQQYNQSCSPGRAIYTVNHTYVNNAHSRQITSKPIEKLINLAPITHSGMVIVPGFLLNGKLGYGTQPANWSTYALNYYRDNNHMAIFSSMMSWLNGGFNATLSGDSYKAALASNSTYDLVWEENFVTSIYGVSTSSGPQGDTVIDSTRFNAAFGTYTNSSISNPLFNITVDLLNDYLLNMTTSIALSYGRWNTTTNATTSTMINVYEFSQPLNLLLPYFLTLLLSLPFLILGMVALMKNGVSAIDGGFLQIITTSTGSAILDRAAAGGCLGGDESVPKELKDLKIRYGEFIGRSGPSGIRRAGFGVESEVKPLQKGGLYGIARWL